MMLSSTLHLVRSLSQRLAPARSMGADVDSYQIDADDQRAAAELVKRGWAERVEDGRLRLVPDSDGFAGAVELASAMPELEVMRALSLWQPWAWAVASGHKRIENRTWRPRSAVGSWIAIHAGRRIDASALDFVREQTGEEPTLHHGAIVGVARLREVIPDGAGVRELSDADRRWFNGPWGWFFESAIELDEPIPCRGFQSLWYLQPPIRALLQGALRA